MFFMMMLFFLAIIISFIMRAIEIASEAGSTVVRKSSDFTHYIKTQWEEAQNGTQM